MCVVDGDDKDMSRVLEILETSHHLSSELEVFAPSLSSDGFRRRIPQ
jgi:hypothetical protein